jgi:hypothetical protein
LPVGKISCDVLSLVGRFAAMGKAPGTSRPYEWILRRRAKHSIVEFVYAVTRGFAQLCGD